VNALRQGRSSRTGSLKNTGKNTGENTGRRTLPLTNRAGNIRRHRAIMIALYGFALPAAGGFTLMPGRIRYQVAFGA